MGGGHGHDEPSYLHAKHMYNLDRMSHQKLKMSLSVLTVFSIGVSVPIYICCRLLAEEDGIRINSIWMYDGKQS